MIDRMIESLDWFLTEWLWVFFLIGFGVFVWHTRKLLREQRRRDAEMRAAGYLPKNRADQTGWYKPDDPPGT
jgi:hypothetical protein